MNIQVSEDNAAGYQLHSIVKCQSDLQRHSPSLGLWVPPLKKKKKRPVIKAGSLVLAKSRILKQTNNRRRLVTEIPCGAYAGSTLDFFLTLSKVFIFFGGSWDLNHNESIWKSCACFPRIPCNWGGALGLAAALS